MRLYVTEDKQYYIIRSCFIILSVLLCHQLRLHFAISKDDSSVDSKNCTDLNQGLLELRHGKSWLWFSRVSDRINLSDNDEAIDSNSQLSDKDCSFPINNSSMSDLWFEVGTRSNKVNDDHLSQSIDSLDFLSCDSSIDENSRKDNNNFHEYVFNGEESTEESIEQKNMMM